MASKIAIIGLSGIALAGLIVAYRAMVPPEFQIVEYSESTNSGIYRFGGVENYFGNRGGTQGGRFGWELDIVKNPDGTTNFNLLKNGSFVKVLDVK